MEKIISQEQKRLEDHHRRHVNWKEWGPYLSERAWGTVREDYSKNGDSWDYFTFEDAMKKAYRWNEDGLGGISDRNQYLCFAPALWNGQDPFLKERLFGLSNQEGNHGEDVKEYYFFLDNIPSHSYMKMLYKYPQKAFPYDDLRKVNKERGYDDPEYELVDTGIFQENRYFDLFISYAKAHLRDILISIEVVNRGPDAARCVLMPHLWFRNTWSWGYASGPMNDVPEKPILRRGKGGGNWVSIDAFHPGLGRYFLYAEGSPPSLFTENETNEEMMYQRPDSSPYVKDAFHRAIVNGEESAVNPQNLGTKSCFVYDQMIPAGESRTFRLRLTPLQEDKPFEGFQEIFDERKREADEFYQTIQKEEVCPALRDVQRQAYAGMLWSKQLYYYDVQRWLSSDKGKNEDCPTRVATRNDDWQHLVSFDVISMPDTWEYPWFASWDLAFHCIPFVLLDADFAKRQIILMTREWYMHPNGQLPAYEWNFGDVNPPVLAWAAWRVYQIDGKMRGKHDREFLEGMYHKFLLNFTWWVNKKDSQGNNVFQGGFLGMDNISIFDRSKPLPTGGEIDQSDGSAWMSFFCLLMMKIALELAKEDPIYQDTATKFFEHFLRISYAMNDVGQKGFALWDREDGFFYDALRLPNNQIIPLKVRSLVGLLPLFAVETLEPSMLAQNPVFQRRMDWFISKKQDYQQGMACVYTPGVGSRHLMAILDKDRLRSVLGYLLDEEEFLSPYGIRSVSKVHEKRPFKLTLEGKDYSIDYEPGESRSGLFGGNSNWRGPIWFPINFLIIESLQKFHHYYGDSFQVEFPSRSGNWCTLNEVAEQLSQRLMRMFIADGQGKIPILGEQELFQTDPLWKNFLPFNEYFHGDTGKGLGASHQTGWTGLIAKLIQQSGKGIPEPSEEKILQKA